MEKRDEKWEVREGRRTKDETEREHGTRRENGVAGELDPIRP
jgi:hypothetical protein